MKDKIKSGVWIITGLFLAWLGLFSENCIPMSDYCLLRKDGENIAWIVIGILVTSIGIVKMWNAWRGSNSNDSR
jgi:hypothetical protein